MKERMRRKKPVSQTDNESTTSKPTYREKEQRRTAEVVMSATDYDDGKGARGSARGRPPMANKIYPLTDIDDGIVPSKTGKQS